MCGGGGGEKEKTVDWNTDCEITEKKCKLGNGISL